MSPTPAPPFDPVGFFEAAQDLLSLGRDERYLRSAISRAYYACFHMARLGCRRKWLWQPPETGQHRAVVRKLREQHQTFLARELLKLPNLREHADYDLDTPVDQALCDGALALAADLVPRLRSL